MINKQLMLNQYNKKHSTTYPTMKSLLTALYSQLSGIKECAKGLKYDDGYSITSTTVLNWLTGYGIPRKGRGGNQRPRLFIEDLLELDTANLTAKEIAGKLGCSQPWVYTILKENNLKYKYITPINKRRRK